MILRDMSVELDHHYFDTVLLEGEIGERGGVVSKLIHF